MVKLFDNTLRDGGNVVGHGFSLELTCSIVKGLLAAGIPDIETGNCKGLGSYEMMQSTDAPTDEEYMKALQPYVGQGRIGMFQLAKIAKTENIRMAADYGLNFLRVGANASDGTGSLAAIDAVKKAGLVCRYSLMKAYVSSPEELAALEHLFILLERAGATLVRGIHMEAGRAIYTIMIHEYKACMNDYLASVRSATPIHTMADIIAFNDAHANTAIPLGQHILLRAQYETSGRMIEPAYLRALQDREDMIEKLDRVFNDYNIDIMLTEAFSTLAPFCGFPSMTLPMGQRSDRAPIPCYWMARRFDEAVLVKVGRAVEKLLGLTLRP